jgi:hypothetical protein
MHRSECKRVPLDTPRRPTPDELLTMEVSWTVFRGHTDHSEALTTACIGKIPNNALDVSIRLSSFPPLPPIQKSAFCPEPAVMLSAVLAAVRLTIGMEGKTPKARIHRYQT